MFRRLKGIAWRPFRFWQRLLVTLRDSHGWRTQIVGLLVAAAQVFSVCVNLRSLG